MKKPTRLFLVKDNARRIKFLLYCVGGGVRTLLGAVAPSLVLVQCNSSSERLSTALTNHVAVALNSIIRTSPTELGLPVLEFLGEAEVRKFEMSLPVEQQILGFKVAVDETERV